MASIAVRVRMPGLADRSIGVRVRLPKRAVRQSECGSGCCDAVPTAGYGTVSVAAKSADDILTVAVVYAPPGVVSPGQGHLQCLVGQLGRDARAHGPAHDPPRPYVHHERRVQPALAGLHVGDVGEPRHVGAAGLEPASDQVLGGVPLRRALLARGALGARARHPAPSALAHDSRHALARGTHAHAAELEEHLRCAVYVAHFGPDPGDQFGEPPSRSACALGGRLFHAQWPRRVALSAAHIPGTGQAPSLREMNSNFALFADSPAAACWRRRRSLLKYLVLPLQALVLALEPAQVLGHLQRVLAARRIGRVGLLDPVRQASGVASEPAGHLRARGAGFPVQLHGSLLELGRVLGRWGPHSRLQSSVARIMRSGNRLVNGNGADSDSD